MLEYERSLTSASMLWCRYVDRVGSEYAWVELAPGLQARLHALDACADLPSLRSFPESLQAGQLISAAILQVPTGLLREMADLLPVQPELSAYLLPCCCSHQL